MRTFKITDGTTVGCRNHGTFTNLFRDCVNMTDCDITNLSFSGCTSTMNMFKGCSSLKSLQFVGENPDTSTVSNMSGMFYGCSSPA